MAVQILFRRGTASDWTNVNPILSNGEPGVETDTGRLKIGDGVSTWSALPYTVNIGGSGASNLNELTDVTISSPTNGQVLKYNGTQWVNGTDSTGGGGGSGTVTSVSVTSANGFYGSVNNSTTTPQITIATNVAGLLKGNGTAVTAATPGSDYQAPIVLTTNGNSGPASFVGNTLNIPQYSGSDGNTTYGISAEIASGGADIRLTGSDSSTDFVKIAAGNNVTVTRTDANTITISSSGGSGVTSLSGLSDVSLSTLSTGQVLKWNGTNWVNDTDATGGSSLASLDDVPGVVLTSPSNGQVLKFNGTNWVNDTDLNTGTGSIALNDVTDVELNNLSVGQVLKWNGTNWVNDTDATGGSSLTSLDDVPGVVLTSPSNGQVLKFNGTNWVNDTDTGTVITSLDDVPGVVLTSPANGQVLKFNGTNWVNDTDSTATLFNRSTASGTTSTLTDGASENINITGFKSYALLKIQTSAAAWVRLYSDVASRTADESRLEGVDPLPGAGVIAEIITTGPQTVIITPGTIGFNNEETPTTSIPVRVTNKSGAPETITVTMTLIQLEA